MGYRSQGGSRRGAGQRFQKSLHAKAKVKARKHKDKSRLLEEHVISAEEIAEKTLNSLKRLGEQKFAVSPFSQYFNDWLLNLNGVLTELETNQAIKVDEAFVNERQQVLTKTEQQLAELKREEAKLNQAVKELADSNHLLVEIDAEYATKTREIGSRKNAEIQRLTLNVQNLEAELDRVKAMKTSLFRLSKKEKARKEEETQQELNSAKAELESALDSFRIEQEKLHDEYEKKKQAVIERVQRLEKEVEKLESDSSPTVRRDACETLVENVKALLERQPKPSAEPSP
jgi:chromosome segregation ATPase